MTKFLASFFLLMAIQSYAATCADFSGVYFNEGLTSMPSCTIIDQSECSVSKQTLYFGPFSPVTVEFVTDGQLRRYSIEPSMRKALRYDSNGNLVFIGIDDNGTRIDSVYEKISSDIHVTSKWTDSSGSNVSEDNFIGKASLKECLETLSSVKQ